MIINHYSSCDVNLITQDPKTYTKRFHVLEVDRLNNIRMSEFIKMKLGSFENGKAFFEFKQPEDLPCYKEIVHVTMDVYNKMNRVEVNHYT